MMQYHPIGLQACPSASPDYRIGLIVLSTDYVSEHDFFTMAQESPIGVYANRITFENPITKNSLLKLKDNLSDAAENILPGERLDSIIFACTAASAAIGEDVIQKLIGRAAHVITPTKAAFEALKAIKAQKINILTPYTKEVSQGVCDFFHQAGFDIEQLTYLGIEDDTRVADISSALIAEIAKTMDHSLADALFISCTGFRSALVAHEIEKSIGKSVITSNQASFWYALKKMQLSDFGAQYGQIFQYL